MNELQEAICKKFSLQETVENPDEATHIITPQGRLYELDNDHDIQIPTGDVDTFHYINCSTIYVVDFLIKLGVVWVKHSIKDYTMGDVLTDL